MIVVDSSECINKNRKRANCVRGVLVESHYHAKGHRVSPSWIHSSNLSAAYLLVANSYSVHQFLDIDSHKQLSMKHKRCIFKQTHSLVPNLPQS